MLGLAARTCKCFRLRARSASLGRSRQTTQLCLGAQSRPLETTWPRSGARNWLIELSSIAESLELTTRACFSLAGARFGRSSPRGPCGARHGRLSPRSPTVHPNWPLDPASGMGARESRSKRFVGALDRTEPNGPNWTAKVTWRRFVGQDHEFLMQLT